MIQTKEISEELRVVDAQDGKGYKKSFLKVWTPPVDRQVDHVEMENVHHHCYPFQAWLTNKGHNNNVIHGRITKRKL